MERRHFVKKGQLSRQFANRDQGSGSARLGYRVEAVAVVGEG